MKQEGSFDCRVKKIVLVQLQLDEVGEGSVRVGQKIEGSRGGSVPEVYNREITQSLP